MSLDQQHDEPHLSEEKGTSRISETPQQITSPDSVEKVRQAQLLQVHYNSGIADVSASSSNNVNQNTTVELAEHDDSLHREFDGGDAIHGTEDEAKRCNMENIGIGEDVELDKEKEIEGESNQVSDLNEEHHIRQCNRELRTLEEVSSRIYEISQQIAFLDPVNRVRQSEQDADLVQLLQIYYNSSDVSASSSTIELTVDDDSLYEVIGRVDAIYVPEDENERCNEEIIEIGGNEVDYEGELDDDEVNEDDINEDELNDDELHEDNDINEDQVNEDDHINEDELDYELDEDDHIDEEYEIDEEDDEDFNRLFPEEIDRLPTHINTMTRSSTGSDKTANVCQICKESYAKGDELRVIPCFHKFHSGCIDPWLLRSNSCPLCRIKVDFSERLGVKPK